MAKVTQQGRYYFHKDHLGSSTAMTDASGAKVETTEYVPYGEMREYQGTEVTNYKFTDQELDLETGLYNYGARLYDPVIARFISADPYVSPKLAVNLASLPRVTDADFLFTDPQRLNRYSYCLNNPLKYIDPNGLSSDWVHGKYKGVDYDISTTSFNPFTGFIHFMPKEFGILAVNISTALFGHTTLASRFAEMGMHVIGEHASFAHRLGPVLGVVVHDMLSIFSKVTNVFADLGLIPDSLRVNDPDEPSDSKALAEAMAAVAKAEQGWRSQGDARNNNHCDPYGTESIGYGDGGSSNSSPEGMSNSGSGDGDDGRAGDPWGGSEDSGYNSGDDNGFDGL